MNNVADEESDKQRQIDAVQDNKKEDQNNKEEIVVHIDEEENDREQRVDHRASASSDNLANDGQVPTESSNRQSRVDSKMAFQDQKINAMNRDDKKQSSFMQEANKSLTQRISNLLESANASLHIPGLDDDIVDMPFQNKQGQGQGQQRNRTTMASNTQRNNTDRQNITLELTGTQQSAGGQSNRVGAASMDHQNEGRPSTVEIKRNVTASKIQNTESWVDDIVSQDRNIEVIIDDGPMDGQAQGPPRGEVSVIQTYFNMFKCFIGIGILATPHAIQDVGIIGGTTVIVACGCLNLYTMGLQIACKNKLAEEGKYITSYSEMGYAVYGPRGKAFVDLCITISQLGFCIAYLLFIGHQMDQVICIETRQDFCNNMPTYITFGMLILIPISWLKTFTFISYISLFANISIIFALTTIMFYSERQYMDKPQLHSNLRYLDPSALPLFFGIAVFNFEGNGVILNIHSSMKEPEKFEPLMRNVIIGVIFTLVIFSITSYEAFGYTINDMVTLNLPHDDLTSTVQLIYCLALLGSYPLQIIPAIDITEKTALFQNMPMPSCFDSYPFAKNIILRTLIVISTALLAMIVPKFGLFINLSGAFACTALAFIMPILMYNSLYKSEIGYVKMRIHYVLAFFGILCGFVSVVMSIQEIVGAFTRDEKSAVPAGRR